MSADCDLARGALEDEMDWKKFIAIAVVLIGIWIAYRIESVLIDIERGKKK
jgi:uncharacterized membrane protein YdcZ (DUF606 family)